VPPNGKPTGFADNVKTVIMAHQAHEDRARAFSAINQTASNFTSACHENFVEHHHRFALGPEHRPDPGRGQPGIAEPARWRTWPS
jgi:hypothetical protein